MNLSTTIKSIQDIMRKDDGVDGDAQRIGQLTWMLFLKIFDQCEETWEDDAEDRGETYRSPTPEECRWRNWAAYKDGKPQKPATDLIAYVNNTVFPGLKELNIENDPKAKVVREVFVDANNYMKSGTLMLGVIEKLDEAINFHDMKARGQMGAIYEQILNDLRSAGNAGEFYTPRAVTEFMVQMVNPRLDKRETVLDPACGTGGFLTATIDHFEKQLTTKSSAEDKKAIAECIRGIEKKQLPHLLCTTNMLLHNIEVPSMIEHRNTLGRPWNEWGLNERVDCVITNPPFGGMEDDTVGNDFPSDIQTKETADMFLVLIVKKLLKDKGGRGAIVLPDGTLFGEGVKAKIKELLMDNCHLHTIIRLPNGVFNPYTGIKTNLLFFTKGKTTDTIWFYEHHYLEGVKSYSKTKPLRVEELQPIADWWGQEADGFKDRVETEQAWKVDFKQLKEGAIAKAQPHWDKAETLNNEATVLNEQAKELRSSIKGEKKESIRKKAEEQIQELIGQIEKLRQQAKDEQATGDRHYWPIYNLDIKNPNGPEEESLDPDALLIKYQRLLSEIEQTENQLRDELAAALSHHFESGETA
ncbi:MAG: N-6 DNA methylase [Proteobacteria bacterium]|nr:N-6 DNA methylase [Desulfobulbaceae bacterium]MBU4152407.1 N-6 DNA methylase [Pseudomonadota bacterium]